MTAGGSFIVVSFDRKGNLRWAYRDRGSDSSGMNEARRIAVDPAGNVYAAGYLKNLSSGRDLAVVALDYLGNVRWRYVYNGPGNGVDGASCIVLDTSGKNIYVGGYTTGSGTMLDFTVIGLDTAGTKKWVYQRNGTENNWDEVFAIAAGGSGSRIYSSGYTRNTNTGMDFTVVALDTAGVERSVYAYNGPENSWDESYDLAVDKAGNVYAAGYSEQGVTPFDWAVVKVDTSGKSPWQFFYKGAGDSMDWAERILVDDEDNVYSAGTTTGLGTGFDMSLVKLDRFGKKLWVYNYDGPAHSDDEAYGLAMDEAGNLFVAGYSMGVSADLVVASVDTAGNERWVYRYDGEGGGDDVAWSVKCDGKGYVYACGSSTIKDGSVAAVVVKLKTDQPKGAVEKQEPVRGARIPTVMAANRIFLPGPVEIFDHTGRLVFKNEGTSKIRVPGLAAGVYFIETKEGGRCRWQKVVVVK